MRLIPNWKDAYKWWSVWGAVITALLGAMLVALPIVRNQIPAAAYDWLMFVVTLAVPVIAAFIPVLRVVDQGEKSES